RRLRRGWCESHYDRWRRHGDPLAVINFETPEEAFEARTEWRGDCLVWTGGKVYAAGETPDAGYGGIKVNGRYRRAHRYAWERIHGAVPEGMQIDHMCHNRLCVNVEHLRLVTNLQNTKHRSGPNRGSKTGIRNVYPTRSGKYQVLLGINGKIRAFGTYSDIEEAATVA